MTLSLDILDRLIAFDTVSNRSNLDLISYVEDFLRARRFRVHRIPDPTEEKASTQRLVRKPKAAFYCLRTPMLCRLRGRYGPRRPFS
jgi:acetylornithine deacetylase